MDALSVVQGQPVGWVAGLCAVGALVLRALGALLLRALRGRTSKGGESKASLPRLVLFVPWQFILAGLGVSRSERRRLAVNAARADLGLAELPPVPPAKEAA